MLHFNIKSKYKTIRGMQFPFLRRVTAVHHKIVLPHSGVFGKDDEDQSMSSIYDAADTFLCTQHIFMPQSLSIRFTSPWRVVHEERRRVLARRIIETITLFTCRTLSFTRVRQLTRHQGVNYDIWITSAVILLFHSTPLQKRLPTPNHQWLCRTGIVSWLVGQWE